MRTPWSKPALPKINQPHDLGWLELHFARPAEIPALRQTFEHLAANSSLGSFVVETRLRNKGLL